jgi:hypothetical protein
MRYNTCPPSYPPQKGGGGLKAYRGSCCLCLKNLEVLNLMCLAIFHLGKTFWDFDRDFG